jgi:tRNA-uridine 2-sulfurtransferase
MKQKIAVAMSGPAKLLVKTHSRTAQKVAVALSGGVDSAVAAALLVDQGYEVIGIHLHLWCESGKDNLRENKCCSTESLEAARKTAFQLGIPFHVLNFEEIFKKSIVEYFLGEYGQGRTPNPCVQCNKMIKFGALLEYIRAMGFDYLATGHYVRLVEQNQNSNRKSQNHSLNLKTFHLLTGIDQTKDQSYFLYNLNQEQLQHLLFPLGEYVKPEVRKLAEKYNLPSARRLESQEICFFAENDYRPFLERNISNKIKPGKVVDNQGNVIGKHRGLPLYTIGQRHGFSTGEKLKSQNSNLKTTTQRSKLIPPFYVIKKDIKKNQMVVGFGKETEVKEFGIKGINWVDGDNTESENNQLWVKVRHGGGLLKCKMKSDRQKVKSKKKDHNLSRITYHISLSEAQRGISPGQSAVIYKQLKNSGWEVLGGGIIA